MDLVQYDLLEINPVVLPALGINSHNARLSFSLGEFGG
jgi:hypothetical protein